MKRFLTTIGIILFFSQIEAFAQQPTEEELFAQLQPLTSKLQRLDFALQGPRAKKESTAALQTGLQGAWWREASWIKALELTPDQQKKMNEALLQNRLKLIDLDAALKKEELILEPLVENIHPGDDAKILAQIDRVAEARAGLEKANSRLLLAIREILTQDQWNKLPANSNDWPGNLRWLNPSTSITVTPNSK